MFFRREGLGSLALIAANIIVYAFLLAPIAVVVVSSFDSSSRLNFPPLGFSLKWYKAFFLSAELWYAIRLSAYIAAVSTIIAVIIGTLAAFALDRYSFPGAQAISSFLLSPLMIPVIVIGLSVLLFYAVLGVGSSPLGFILGHVLIITPYVVRTVLSTLSRFDMALEESAIILGANDFRAKWHITLPLIKPGIFGGAAFAFMTSFDNVPISIFLAGGKLMPLPVKIYAQLDAHGIDPVFAALSTIVIILTVALIMVIDRYVGLANYYGQSGGG